MIFATVCIGEQRRPDLMHLLNDIRNIDHKIFVLTNIDLHLDHFQFSNVIQKKIDVDYWTDFQRFEIIKKALQEGGHEYVYYMDCDSRFINFRSEKFQAVAFEELLSKADFDIMCPLFLTECRNQLVKPTDDENKNNRGFTFGYDSVVNYLKSKNQNYEMDVLNKAPLETLLIFRKSDKIEDYLDELMNFSKILIKEEVRSGRKHIAPACGFAMAMLQNVFNIKIIENSIVYHFFKGNFLREVFPFNFKIDIEDKVF